MILIVVVLVIMVMKLSNKYLMHSLTLNTCPQNFSSDIFVVCSLVSMKLLAMLQNMGVTQCGIVEV